jgi:hypothetical protein
MPITVDFQIIHTKGLFGKFGPRNFYLFTFTFSHTNNFCQRYSNCKLCSSCMREVTIAWSLCFKTFKELFAEVNFIMSLDEFD